MINEKGEVHVTTPEELQPAKTPKGQAQPAAQKPTGKKEKTLVLQMQAEPCRIEAGKPISDSALAVRPARLDGLRSWTLETVAHRGSVTDIAYSPDGQSLVTACDDDAIRIWQVQTGLLESVLLGHDGGVTGVSFSPDGRYLASSSMDGTIRLWQPARRRLLRTLRVRQGPVRCVAWSPDGRLIASGTDDGAIRLWDVATVKEAKVLRDHSKGIKTLEWSPDNRMLASIARDDLLLLWDAAAGRAVRSFTMKWNWMADVSFSRDGSLIAAVTERQNLDEPSTNIWSVSTGDLVRSIGPKPQEARGDAAVAFSPDGKRILTGANSFGWTVGSWDMETGECIWAVPSGGGRVNAVRWSPDGRSYAFATSAGVVQIGVADTGEKRVVLPASKGNFVRARFSPDGSMLAAGLAPTALLVWDWRSWRLLGRLIYTGQRITELAWSSDNGKIAFGVYPWDTAQVYDLNAKKKPALFRDTAVVGRIAWSPDGKLIATGRPANTLYNAASRKVVANLPGSGYALAFSPDSSTLARGNGNKVDLVKVPSGEVAGTLACAEHVSQIAYSPDGKRLAVGERSGVVSVFDMERGTKAPMRTLTCGSRSHVDPILDHVRELCWTPDGKTLLAGTTTHWCVWDAETGKLLQAGDGMLLDLSPDGKLMAWAKGGALRLGRYGDEAPLVSIALLPERSPLLISPSAHYRGPDAPGDLLRYVALTDSGEQLTLRPDEFAQRFGWQNDPDKVQRVPAAPGGPTTDGDTALPNRPDARPRADAAAMARICKWQSQAVVQNDFSDAERIFWLDRYVFFVAPERARTGDAATFDETLQVWRAGQDAIDEIVPGAEAPAYQIDGPIALIRYAPARIRSGQRWKSLDVLKVAARRDGKWRIVAEIAGDWAFSPENRFDPARSEHQQFQQLWETELRASREKNTELIDKVYLPRLRAILLDPAGPDNAVVMDGRELRAACEDRLEEETGPNQQVAIRYVKIAGPLALALLQTNAGEHWLSAFVLTADGWRIGLNVVGDWSKLLVASEDPTGVVQPPADESNSKQ